MDAPPSRAFRYAGRVATSVLPSPVFISAMLPWCSDRAAHDLDVEVPLADGPLGGFADHRERLGQEVVEGLAVASLLAEPVGLPRAAPRR